ncbi:type IV secretion system DNA-binding domain-containing protein [Robbsia sp. Bb-Pol-6]|uniref:Type IV secretion system DNA-binding domain-containing protein n=1 Tax=Robbsia betulipollinis TaxID=2981849 RepID=A0ABT3ZMY4_9BURK|nr:type IV secretion system DNA-binding domain-containing protein [Robbsia betulipollinis]MCY0387911.1 type IV secretion system DNA-binding domain-containing protein [Robbsia betulipollinis]
MTKPIRNALFSVPKDLDSDEPFRLVGSAFVTGAIVGSMVAAGAFVLEWLAAGRTGSLGGVTSSFGLGMHARYSMEVLANAVMRKRPFADDVGAYKAWLATLPFMVVKGKAVLAGLFGMGIAALVGRSMWSPVSNVKHVKGTQLHSGPDALKRADAAIKKLNKGNAPFLPLHPSLTWLSEQVWSRSSVVFGSAGAGKSAILANIVYHSQEANHHMVVLDVKGTQAWVLTEINRRLGRSSKNVAVISPFCDSDAVPDIGRDLIRDEDATVFAAAMVPESKDPMWSAGARAVLRVVVLSLIHEYRAAKKKAKEEGLPKPAPWHWGHLAARVSAAMKDIHAWAEATDPMVAQIIKDYEQSATVRSFEITMRTFASESIVPLGKAWGDDPPGAKRRRVSLRAFVAGMDDPTATTPRQLVLRSNEEYEALSQGWLRYTLDFISKSALALPDNPSDGNGRNLILSLDEFLSLGKWESVLKTLEKGRSKGVKCIAIAFQTQSALLSLYGEHDAARIVGNTGIKVIGLAADASIGSELAEPYGNRTVKVTKYSTGGKPSTEEVQEPVMRPELLTSTDRMGPQKKQGRTPAGVNAVVRIGDDLYHLTWPFADPELVPRPPRKTYELARWMTGDAYTKLVDYDPMRTLSDPITQATEETVSAESSGSSGGIALTKDQPIEKPFKIDFAAEHAKRMAASSTRTVTVEETIEVDAQKDSPEYVQATRDAVELQRAQEQRGEWQEQGEPSQAASLVGEAMLESVFDSALSGASMLFKALDLADDMQAPSRHVENAIDSVGEMRTVTVEPPRVQETVVTKKRVPVLDGERTRV